MNNPSLLVVEDDTRFRTLLCRQLARKGFEVDGVGDGEEALQAIDKDEPDVMLLDLGLPKVSGIEVLRRARAAFPSVEIIILTGEGTIDDAIEAVREGAYDFRTKPCPLDELAVAIRKAAAHRALVQRNSILAVGLSASTEGRDLVGGSPAFQELLRVVERCATTDATVLVQGETGTGKERVAELIHGSSSRRDGPFVVVDCGALHEGLLQSELFGHEKGAFTGAQGRKFGLFEVAEGGTLFLDEIGEITPFTQVMLLRVLESRQLRRLGGTRTFPVHVRVVAATNRDLKAMMAAGEFREDLFYRLTTLVVRVPPLRDRKGDVRLFVEHFASRYRSRNPGAPSFSEAALASMELYPWPGNVRQLLHTVEQAMLLVDGGEVGVADLPFGHARVTPTPQASRERSEWPSLADVELAYIRDVLEHVEGHRSQAARMLGISERSLYRRLKDL